MIRLATDTDLQAIARTMVSLQSRTMLARHPEYVSSEMDIMKWLITKMLQTRTGIFVKEATQGISAIVGVSYYSMDIPPHLTILDEWCLWGETARDVAQVWKEAKTWGVARGALFAKRTVLEARREIVTWEELHHGIRRQRQ